MTNERESSELSEFMRYLAEKKEDGDRLPSLSDLSKELKVNIAALREQLEVARSLGLVEVRPKTGIRRRPYSFAPAVRKSLAYATTIDTGYFFDSFSDFRRHVEAAYWYQAVGRLDQADHAQLHGLLERAEKKLEGHPIEIPHGEHRELHLLLYRRLNNPFVIGILEAYWDAYEAVGLNVYTDISYLRNVWAYHRRMVEAVCRGDLDDGYHALVEHADLLLQRTRPKPRFQPARSEPEPASNGSSPGDSPLQAQARPQPGHHFE